MRDGALRLRPCMCRRDVFPRRPRLTHGAGVPLPLPLPLPPGNGEFIDIHIRRPNPTAAFGFGVASMWRIDGRVNVVSWVDSDGPAAGALEREDILLTIDGNDVDELNLEEVKDELRSLCAWRVLQCDGMCPRRRLRCAHAPFYPFFLCCLCAALDFKASIFRPSQKTTETRPSRSSCWDVQPPRVVRSAHLITTFSTCNPLDIVIPPLDKKEKKRLRPNRVPPKSKSPASAGRRPLWAPAKSHRPAIAAHFFISSFSIFPQTATAAARCGATTRQTSSAACARSRRRCR